MREVRPARHANNTAPAKIQPRIRRQLGSADRNSLLLGTALASTLFIGAALCPAPASAQQAILIVSWPTPVDIDNADDCVFPGNCIEITTNGDGAFIDLGNSGNLTAGQQGIYTATRAANSAINIVNTGVIFSGLWRFLLWQRHPREDDRSQ
jgi:hypothetical protein